MQEGSYPWLECQTAPIGSARLAQPTERSALNPVVAVSRPMVLVLSVFGSVHVAQRLQRPHLCCAPVPRRPRPTPPSTLQPRTHTDPHNHRCKHVIHFPMCACVGVRGVGGWVE